MTPHNYSDAPWITVHLAAYDGDVHMVPRALASVAAQDLDRKQIQVIICYDGPPSDEAFAILDGEGTKYPDTFYSFDVLVNPKTGYYTTPRNGARLTTWGFYVANLDADNEWAPLHLSNLLEAIRDFRDGEGVPHFVYSRREYVHDGPVNEGLPLGPTPLIEWTREAVTSLALRPMNNFIDTGDFLVSLGALDALAERTGYVWNSGLRRYGDWDLIKRMAEVGFRGRAVDQVTNIYHIHGGNVSLTRHSSEILHIPEDIYETLRAQGAFK